MSLERHSRNMYENYSMHLDRQTDRETDKSNAQTRLNFLEKNITLFPVITYRRKECTPFCRVALHVVNKLYTNHKVF